MTPNILIVDDEPGIQEAFELMLGDAYGLRMAGSAEEALDLSAEVARSIRLIYLDGALGPGMSGERALPALKIKFPGACIIYIGASGIVRASTLLAAGVGFVLPKPWDVVQLQAIAREGMARGIADN